MLLADSTILEEMKKGNIKIEPFYPNRLNPNSYNVTIGNKLLIYKDEILDPKKKLETEEIMIPEDGYVIRPGKVYIASTIEYTETKGNLVPMLEGRSSIGRLGLFIHVTAGFGDNGFCGKWTLELGCIQPVKIYPDIEIGQLYYEELKGKVLNSYKGKYFGQQEPVESRMYKDFEKKKNI